MRRKEIALTAALTRLRIGSFINVCLTFLFLYPLFNSKRVLNPTVRTVAVRTLVCVQGIAYHPPMLTVWLQCCLCGPHDVLCETPILYTVISRIDSMMQANILVLHLLKGKELAWVCLASCGTDVRF